MAKIEIKSAFVEDAKGSPTFVLKIAEPHSKKNEQGGWDTVSRTFYDVKVSRDSGIDLSQFQKGDRVSLGGNLKTEVREHEGKKFYTLTIWADSVQVAESRGVQQSQSAWGTPQNQSQQPNNSPWGSSTGSDDFGAQRPF